MLLAGIHGLCGTPVGKPSVRAGGAEWEMWPSEMGELELSTVIPRRQGCCCSWRPHADGGEALSKHSCAKSFPLQVQGLHKEQNGLFPSNSP